MMLTYDQAYFSLERARKVGPTVQFPCTLMVCAFWWLAVVRDFKSSFNVYSSQFISHVQVSSRQVESKLLLTESQPNTK